MEARQSPFMLPSCLEAHATSRRKNGDRASCNAPSTRQHPLTPTTAPGSPVVPCSEYTHAHETKRRKKEKITESARRNGENQEPLERSGK